MKAKQKKTWCKLPEGFRLPIAPSTKVICDKTKYDRKKLPKF